MHYVKRVKNRWHVLFSAPETFEFIGSFSNGQDAFALCSYLNGGKPPHLGPNGWKELDEMTRPWTPTEMAEAD